MAWPVFGLMSSEGLMLPFVQETSTQLSHVTAFVPSGYIPANVMTWLPSVTGIWESWLLLFVRSPQASEVCWWPATMVDPSALTEWQTTQPLAPPISTVGEVSPGCRLRTAPPLASGES